MKKIFFITLLFIVSVSGFIFAQQEADKTTHKFDPTRDPFVDVKTAVDEATKTHKRILLDIGGEWCIWCHRLDKFIEDNDDIKTYLSENFIVIKVNFSQENKNEKFLAQFPKIPGYPHFFVLDTDGKFLHSQGTGELEKDKSYSAELILGFLKEWSLKKN
ncbi:MAG: Thiol-disulfide isomerase/thioredoxin domain protein [Stygiobacter sp.]|nr:MAG: Thiol-disulfide isomerase/thioredoxin domain protein [Stygiobacter sp.]KAF0217027.1 MAG: Thiol-disulfide isomerase/thioredoxin domain [Ignavibacteria bacterium]